MYCWVTFREISWSHWDCFRIQNSSRDWCEWCQPRFPQCTEKMDLWAGWVWTITNCSWSEYRPLIGQRWSRDLNTGLWLVNTDHVTSILASDWPNCSWKRTSAPAVTRVWWQLRLLQKYAHTAYEATWRFRLVTCVLGWLKKCFSILKAALISAKVSNTYCVTFAQTMGPGWQD